MRRQGVAPEVQDPELAGEPADVAPAVEPLEQRRVHVGDLEVAHPEDVGLTGGWDTRAVVSSWLNERPLR